MLTLQCEQFWVCICAICIQCMYVYQYYYVMCRYSATYFPDIHHSMDVWHKSKKLKQALAKVIVILMVF